MKAKRVRRTLPIEMLESRRLLTSVVVNTTSDMTDPPGSSTVSLADAIAVANTSTTATTITFSPTVFASAQTIELPNALTFTNTKASTTITGPTAGLTIDDENGGDAGFVINSGVTALISALTISTTFDGEDSSNIDNSGSLTLTNVTFNTVDSGPGVDTRSVSNSGTLNLTGCDLEGRGDGNSGINAGGGIYNVGTCTIVNSTIDNDNAGEAGAIYQDGGTLKVTASTFSNDGSDDGNGGVLDIDQGSATFVNSTLSNNVIVDEDGGSDGGAIWISSNAQVTLSNTTIDNISEDEVGGQATPTAAAVLVSSGGSLTLSNTVIAGMTYQGFDNTPPGIDVSGAVTSKGHNFIDDTGTSTGWLSTDFLGTSNSPLSPGLGALGGNGGPTQTELPAKGSPLIDHGLNSLIPSGITTDQRGLARISNTTVDIGAVEVQQVTPLAGTVIGTSGSYLNDGNTIAKAFDGNLTTFFDGPTPNGNWAGLDLGSTFKITSIGFCPRSGLANRMVGGIFQGSSTADFSSGVVNLYTVAAAPAQNVLTDVGITNTTAFRYVRYLSPSGSYGDVAELQFFGTASTTIPHLTGTVIGTGGSYQNDGNTIAKAFDGNLTTFFDGPTANGNWAGLDLGSTFKITSISYAPRSGYTSRMVGGIFQGSNSSTFVSGVVNLFTVTTAPTAGVLTTATVTNTSAFRYVRYLSANGTYGDVAEINFFGTAVTSAPLTGTVIGTGGSYQNDGNTIAKAFDGNLSTFFDGPVANGNWAGLDTGSAHTISKISFAPRAGYPSRMVGGIFQASNTADFSSGVVNLYTITTAPTAGTLTTVSISNTGTYRYFRYLSPTGSYGDVAEIEFFS